MALTTPAWSRSTGSARARPGSRSRSHRPNGPIESAGEALGLLKRRVKGDLERFKQFIESRGGETGAWRGEVEQDPAT